MKLYVNGDSHAAAAEAVNTHAFAEDDPEYFYLGRAPHPDNKRVSWSRSASDMLKAHLHLDAESASSNQRIIRTTREWIQAQKSVADVLVLIQWSTWERQEWLINGTYYQVNASGIDDVPASAQERYKEFVRSVDWQQCTEQAHQEIYQFHQELEQKNIKHVFFNGNNSFESIPKSERLDWGVSYMGPYDPTETFDAVLKANGYDTVSPISYHYGKESHSFFARYMLQYIIKNKMV